MTALAMYKMKCWDCHKIIGEYAAIELPVVIAYFNCAECMKKDNENK